MDTIGSEAQNQSVQERARNWSYVSRTVTPDGSSDAPIYRVAGRVILYGGRAQRKGFRGRIRQDLSTRNRVDKSPGGV